MSAVQPPRPFSEPSPLVRWLAGAVVILYAIVTILPLVWIRATAFKSQEDAIAYPPKVFFKPTLEGFVDLFTVQTHQSHDFIAKLPPPQTWYERIARDREVGSSRPAIMRRVVVLPQPDGPSRQKNSPFSTIKFESLTATKSPKDLCRD
jgi:multiple sugar transport system permease protein